MTEEASISPMPGIAFWIFHWTSGNLNFCCVVRVQWAHIILPDNWKLASSSQGIRGLCKNMSRTYFNHISYYVILCTFYKLFILKRLQTSLKCYFIFNTHHMYIVLVFRNFLTVLEKYEYHSPFTFVIWTDIYSKWNSKLWISLLKMNIILKTTNTATEGGK